ncbi:hypothetical protein WH47_04429 [Habropoda laboriosa]|uniref:Uncharacterized protein n=1 Tax=Habropoda laboriosa TaxID=597456 RepID=A0A0L7QWX0_9HYME|nr:hypothetical protein WH47_04429 [Habropoda laboriosa]
MKADSQSAERICDTNSGLVHRKEFKTVTGIIFGWDRFNSITMFILIILFCVWCACFSVLYDPSKLDDNSHHHMNMTDGGHHH